MLRRRTLLSLSTSAAIASVARAQDSSWAKVVEAANRQGRLNVLHNTPPPGGDLWLAEFGKAFPAISVEATRLGSAALMQRFETEYSAGASQSDAVITLWDGALANWQKSGWLRTFAPSEAGAMPPQYKHDDQIYTIQLVRAGIISNKSRVREADAPKEWADCFDPKWKDKFGIDPPWRSVAVQEMIAVWEQLGIKDAAQRMKSNGIRFFNGSAGVVQAVIRGDIQVGGVIDPAVISALADGAPIRMTYPASAVPSISTVLMLPAKAPHSEAGMVFLNWALSAAGQQSLVDMVGATAARPGTKPPKLVPGVEGQRIILSTDILTSAKQTAIVNEWRSVFGLQ